MRRRLLAAIAFAIAGTACSGPPTPEYEQAVAAVASARSAEAAVYAPVELRTAESALANYDTAVQARDYKQALRMAIDARDGAITATRRAGDEKARARTRAEQLVRELDTLIQTANTRLAGTAGSKPAPAGVQRLRADVKAATATLQKARSSMASGEPGGYAAAVAAIAPVVDSLRKDLEPAGGQAGRRGR